MKFKNHEKNSKFLKRTIEKSKPITQEKKPKKIILLLVIQNRK